MAASEPGLAKLAWSAVQSWSRDNVPRLGASLAYYTLFSIAPILVIAIAIGGMVFGAEAVRGEIVKEIGGLIGVEGARAVQALLEGASKPGIGTLAVAVGSATFLLAATGAFLELQHALNTIFRVKAEPTKSTLTRFVTNRIRAFGIVLSLGFLLLVSLTVNTALAAMSEWLGRHAWGGALFWTAANIAVSFSVVMLLFAMIYRFLPDARLAWRDVWFGSAVTAALFTIGKEVIGNYLGRSNWATSYGAAGSVLVLLLWIYYSAQLVLYGAELTRAFAERRAGAPPPEDFASRDVDAHPQAVHPRRGSSSRSKRRRRSRGNRVTG